MRQLKSILLVAIVMAFSALTMQAKTKAEAVFSVSPKMHCENCENKIKSNVRFEKGVESIVTDLEHQTVTVVYDAEKTDVAKLKAAFKKVGYEASELKAEAKAKGAKACCKAKADCKKADKQCCAKKVEGSEKQCRKAKADCKKADKQCCSKKKAE